MPNDPSDAIQAIARRLREARKRANFSQRAAAERAGVSYGTLRGWEGGDVAQPGWAVARFGRIYGVSSEWLLAPDQSFFALVDTAAEREAVTSPDISRFGQVTQRLSVLVTEHLVPMTSIKEWSERMAKIEAFGKALPESDHESGEL